MLAYQHWWNAQVGRARSCYSFVDDRQRLRAGRRRTTTPASTPSLNLRYYPAERVMLGGEVLYGIREDNDGDKGDDLRLQFSAQYRF